MADALHQMTAEFVPVQDRILFRVNTREKHEYRIWLTRRLVKKLWGVAVKSFEAEPDVALQAQPRVKSAVMSMKHQQAVQSADFSQKHEPGGKPPPQMPELERPLLALGIRVRRHDKAIEIAFLTAENKTVTLNMTDEMLHALCHILQSAADKAGWDLQLSVGDAATLQHADASVLH
jgi:hypothetical protein